MGSRNRIQTLDVGTPPPELQDWEDDFSITVRFNQFESLPTTKGKAVFSPEFQCFGHQWKIKLYPGGDGESTDGKVGVFLYHCSKDEIKINFTVDERPFDSPHTFEGSTGWGWNNFSDRATVIENLNNGTFVMEARLILVEPSFMSQRRFVPPNPFPEAMRSTYNDETSGDVLFVIEGDKVDNEDEENAKRESVVFSAHSLVLGECAPVLHDLCEPYDDDTPVPIKDVNPQIFEYILRYVYGNEIDEEDLEENAKEIIDAADRYGVVGLKLEAEASYVKSTTINIDNLVDNLHYADSKNCPLLKEVAMDFITENGKEVLEKVSFSDLPGEMLSDLLASMVREKKEITKDNDSNPDDFSTMRVSTLRRKCHKEGYDVDGSRKTMIALLNNDGDNNGAEDDDENEDVTDNEEDDEEDNGNEHDG